jgi:hypothetical protein
VCVWLVLPDLWQLTHTRLTLSGSMTIFCSASVPACSQALHALYVVSIVYASVERTVCSDE